jgi:ferredoxin
MKVTVDPDLCIGCGVCESACPEVFRLADDGIAYVLSDDVPDEAYGDTVGCSELCPVAAIEVVR